MHRSTMIDWDVYEWEQVREGVKRKVVHAGGCTIVLNLIFPNHQPMPHAHRQEQIAYLISGQAEFYVGQEVFKIKSGDMLVIPANETHHIKVIGESDCINLDIFVPKRDDYTESSLK